MNVKKVVVLVAAMGLMSSAAMASSVALSKHNLSTSSPGAVASDYDEICVFCHTPHAADTSVTLAPLWNRTVTEIAGGAVYTSGTLEATSVITIADIAATDAGLCLSCHDGASLTDPLVNPSNLAGNVDPTITGSMAASANLGTDFDNDHPIGFDYNAAQGTDGGLVVDPDLASNVVFYAGEMWCSSCHNVHDDANYPFLVEDNAGSALCLTCHIK